MTTMWPIRRAGSTPDARRPAAPRTPTPATSPASSTAAAAAGAAGRSPMVGGDAHRRLPAVRPAVAQEQIAAVFADRVQRQPGRRGDGRAGDDAFGLARDEDGGDREAELVEDAGAGQRPVEARPALGQHVAESPLPQQLHGPPEVDPA